MNIEKIRKNKNLFHLAIGIVFVFLLFFFLSNPYKILQSLQNIDFFPLTLMLLWLTVDRFLMSYKWTLLLMCLGLNNCQGAALRAYYLSSFVSCLLPSTITADFLRATIISGPHRPLETILASIVMERTLGLLASTLAGLSALILLAQLIKIKTINYSQLSWIMSLTLGLTIFTILILLFSLSHFTNKILTKLDKLSLSNHNILIKWLYNFLKAYYNYRHYPGILILFLMLSFLEQIVPIISNWLIARALHYNLSLFNLAAITPIVMALARLPIWFSPLGLVEGLFILFFSLIDVDNSQAFLLGIFTNISNIIISLPGLMFYNFRSQYKK